MKNQCIAIETLANYIFKRLSSRDRDQAESHFAECDDCLEKLIMNRELLKDKDLTQLEAASPHATRPALQKIIDPPTETFSAWLYDLICPAWLGSTVSVRNRLDSNKTASPGAVFVKKEMKDLHTEIYFKQMEEKRVSIWVNVFQDKKPASNIYLFLMQENGASAARLLNCKYERFDKIPYGLYSLQLEQNTIPKGSCNFKIDERGIYER